MEKAILTIKNDREFIDFENKKYYLVGLEEFTFVELAEFDEVTEQMQNLDLKKLEKLKSFQKELDRIIKKLLKAPWWIRKKLTLINKLNIINYASARQKKIFTSLAE